MKDFDPNDARCPLCCTVRRDCGSLAFCDACLANSRLRVMTPEEAEVVEAARAWDAFGSIENVTRLRYAVACLPKPVASLVERLRREAAVRESDPCNYDEGPTKLMLEAADEIERRGAK